MTIHFDLGARTDARGLYRQTSYQWSPLHKFAFFTALAGCILFFLPVVGALKPGSSGWPGYLSGSDTKVFYFPAFMEGYSRFWGGGLAGIDFGTNGGASVFALRANMLPYYPPYIAAYLVFDVSDYTQAAIAYTLIQAVHLFAGLYFSVLLGSRYFGLSRPASVLFGSLYLLSFLSSMYFSYATFYFQMALIPILAYAFCKLLFARTMMGPILVSPLVLLHLLTNYAPTMAASLATAVAISVYVWFTHLRHRLSNPYWCLASVAGSIAIATLVATPYYLGQVDYFQKSVTTSRALNEVAHSLAFSGRDLFSAVSQSIKAGMAETEGRLLWGLIPIAIWLIGLGVLVTNPTLLSERARRLLGFSLAIYLGVLGITMGTSLVMSDTFYYGVPIFGTMHAYQRFLLFAQIFFALAIAALASITVTHLSARARSRLFVIGTSLYLVTTVLVSLAPNEIDMLMSRETFLIELFLLQIALTLLAMGRSQQILLPIAVLCALLGVRPMYDVQVTFGGEDAGSKMMPHTKEADAKLAEFLNANSDKPLKKMLSVYSEYEPYLPRNHPWQISSQVRVINFAGYEPHLSRVREYTNLMGGNFGDYDRNWVLRTGTDFVAWTTASEDRLKRLIVDTVSLGPTLRLSDGVSVAKLIYASPFVIGQSSNILSLLESKASLWPVPLAIDGWDIRNGRIVKVPGAANHIGFQVRQKQGLIYEVEVDIVGSTQGSVSIALGGTRGDPLPGAATGRFARAFVSDGINDLWITATPDFDGAMANIVVRERGADTSVSANVLFDNGIFRLEGTTAKAEVVGFQTDWSKTVRIGLSAESPARLAYMLWPIDYLVPYLDGKPVQWVRTKYDPAYLDIPPGDHVVELRFFSLALSLFSWALFGYAILIVVAFARWAIARRGRLRAR